MHALAQIFAPLLIGLCSLGLHGYDKFTSTTTVRNMEDGARLERSWSRTWKERAEFKCVASSSGSCKVVVFVSNCHRGTCTTRTIDRLTLRPGTTHRLIGLPPGFRHCIAHVAMPAAPACLDPEVRS